MNTPVANAIKDIEQQGYCRLPGLLDAEAINITLSTVKTLALTHRDLEINDIPRLDTGQETVYNLQNKNYDLLALLLKCDSIQQILMHFLNDQWHQSIDLSEPNYILRHVLTALL